MKMKMRAIFLVTLAAILLVASARSQDRAKASRQEQTQETARRVKELQKERLAALQDLVEITSTLYKSARTTPEELCEARLLLSKAQLETAQTEADRIAIHEKLVNELKLYEEVAEAAVSTARGTRSAVLKVKAMRLEAQIQLEEAKDGRVHEKN